MSLESVTSARLPICLSVPCFLRVSGPLPTTIPPQPSGGASSTRYPPCAEPGSQNSRRCPSE
jgi:hypothetical protein